MPPCCLLGHEGKWETASAGGKTTGACCRAEPGNAHTGPPTHTNTTDATINNRSRRGKRKRHTVYANQKSMLCWVVCFCF